MTNTTDIGEIGRDAAAEFTAAVRNGTRPAPEICEAITRAAQRCGALAGDESLPESVRQEAALRQADLASMLTMDAFIAAARADMKANVPDAGTATLVPYRHNDVTSLCVEYDAAPPTSAVPALARRALRRTEIQVMGCLIAALVAVWWSEGIALALIVVSAFILMGPTNTIMRARNQRAAVAAQSVMDDYRLSTDHLAIMQNLCPDVPRGSTSDLLDDLFAAPALDVRDWMHDAIPLLVMWNNYTRRADLDTESRAVVDALGARLRDLLNAGRDARRDALIDACQTYTNERSTRHVA